MVTLNQLLEITTIEGLPHEEQIDIIGNLFDLSLDNGSLSGIDHAFNLSKQIKIEDLDDINFTILQYDFSNGWSYLRKLKHRGTANNWLFQMEELTNEILHLRKAIASPGFEKADMDRQCQMYTNLGNSFSFIGRFVEAQEYWNKAIRINPEFAMAIGNMANGLTFYGRVLYDNIHNNLFQVTAYHHLIEALQFREYLHTDAEQGFQHLHDWLKDFITKSFPEVYLNAFPKLNKFDLGNDLELRSYRLWSLENKLYINPLNDLGPHTDACHDCLNLPTLTLPANRPPVCLNLYNQIKQEFATARYSYYISQLNDNPHFSDIDVPLVETMETVRYSYYIEQLKIAFRLAYSILDKIAYLLNDYLDLQIAQTQVSFRGLWYSNSKKMELRSFFSNSENWALRGLYWLSKDLYEKERDFDTVLEPDAKEVATIRNFIEHKGFKIVSDFPVMKGLFTEPDISFSISRSEFERKTLKLLKLTRAAIIYVAIAVSHEEGKKDHTSRFGLPIETGTIPKYMRT
ncbi:LA2681 family HEPN domain-containing protein [Pedobacter sp. B4-66]|uniref:LA2681 family HEPN domain-containing protein n=1 Tax=Pedobacter sp. B4-66 TaxID=2817280 RepID=UPI001BDACB3B|nr:LA2681 family HEPN domain-containing protein [Pedobacter sp. B4-66]